MYIANPSKKYKQKEHLTYCCQYHVIFCPKYRRPVLTDGIDERMKEIFEEISEKYDFRIVDIDISPDNVHLIIDCNPRFGIMECIRKLKSGSASILREEFPTLKSKLPTMWTRNAFISTVGDVSLDAIKKYIDDQKNR